MKHKTYAGIYLICSINTIIAEMFGGKYWKDQSREKTNEPIKSSAAIPPLVCEFRTENKGGKLQNKLHPLCFGSSLFPAATRL